MSISSQTLFHKTLISTNSSYCPGSNSCLKSSVWNWNERRNNVFVSGLKRTSFGGAMTGFHVQEKFSRRRNGSAVCIADSWSSVNDSDSYKFTRKRKVLEHICLLKAKGGLSDEDEKDMLDHLYTTQYQMGGIVSISLGRLSDQNPDGYTHAVYMRFQQREDLAKFYKNSFYLGVLKDHVMPYCHGLISVDYESEVEDDMLAIFRKGEEFNYGVELMLLVSVVESADSERVEDALAYHAMLTREFPSMIVQSTQGSTLIRSTEYTHASVIRFRSSEAYEMFVSSSEYIDMWITKFEPITQKILAVRFSVDPVGTELM